ncbi:MAG: transaldolase [Acidimicrobiales bacterium]
MTRLHQLFDDHGQSPWIDNLSRSMVRGGRLAQLVDQGIRGVTSNPTIFAKAISAGSDYDAAFAGLLGDGVTVEDAYWDMVVSDITEAMAVLAPVHRASNGADGFVSLEVGPALAHDSDATVEAARALDDRIDGANLFVKVPATAEGVVAVRRLAADGRSINITLIFSLDRYDAVIEAYLAGLEEHRGDLSGIASVASFFVSRVDTEVDRRLDAIGTDAALALRGRAAVAQARLAYALFVERFSGPRWAALAARGARCQRPLWASTSTKNPAYPDLLYVDGLIGPDTVNTLPDATVDAFVDHGTLARTVDADLDGARRTLAALSEVGVDMDDVASTLEREGVDSFAKSFDDLLEALAAKTAALKPAGH